jgi:thiol-disulfide isomerase/thioredoxin
MTEPEKIIAAQDETANTPEKVHEPIAELGDKPKRQAPLKSPHRAAATHKLVIAGVLVTLILAIAGFIFLRHTQNTVVDPAVTNVAAPKAQGPLKAYATGELAGLITFATPQKAENITFFDRDKKSLNLAHFKGQVVVLNVWATWCAPCRHEMPTLANLSKTYTDKNLKVVPVSVDVEGDFPKVISFMDVMAPLNVYTDPNFAAPKAFGIQGMPVTLILNKKGDVVARIDGVAKWDTPESYALMDRLLSE